MDSFRSLSDSGGYVSVEQSCEPNQTVCFTYCKKTISTVKYNTLAIYIIVNQSDKVRCCSLVAELSQAAG